MPIIAPELAPDFLDAVRRAVSATGRFPRRGGGVLSLSLPHPVFTAGLEPLAAEKPLLEAAELTGRRVLLEEDQAVVAAAELAVSEGDGRSAASINRGPFVHSTVEALRTAERDQRVESSRFEVRLLQVVALYVTALWLHGSEADSDLFIPLSPAPKPLRAHAVYDARTFESDLVGMAKQVVSAYQAAERQDELGS
jgi:hypothetical protein